MSVKLNILCIVCINIQCKTVKRYTIDAQFQLKWNKNRKSFAFYRIVTLPMSLSDPNRRKPPNFDILHRFSYLRNGNR